jgi:hypothetical protein
MKTAACVERYRLRILACAFAIVSVLGGSISLLADDPKPALTVVDEAGKAHSISAPDFAKLPRQKVTMKDRDNTQHEYEGTLLHNLLESAGIELGDKLRGPRLLLYLVIEAKDGYRVVYALSELDPTNAEGVFLLADRRDGKPLPENEAPYRLVIPGEKRHARWIRQVQRLTIANAAKQ